MAYLDLLFRLSGLFQRVAGGDGSLANCQYLIECGAGIAGLEVAGDGPDAGLEVTPVLLLGLPARERSGEAIGAVLFQPFGAVGRLQFSGGVHEVGDAAVVACAGLTCEKVIEIIFGGMRWECIEVRRNFGGVEKLHASEVEHTGCEQEAGDVVALVWRSGERLRLDQIFDGVLSGEARSTELVCVLGDASERLRVERIVPDAKAGLRTEGFEQKGL